MGTFQGGVDGEGSPQHPCGAWSFAVDTDTTGWEDLLTRSWLGASGLGHLLVGSSQQVCALLCLGHVPASGLFSFLPPVFSISCSCIFYRFCFVLLLFPKSTCIEGNYQLPDGRSPFSIIFSSQKVHDTNLDVPRSPETCDSMKSLRA